MSQIERAWARAVPARIPSRLTGPADPAPLSQDRWVESNEGLTDGWTGRLAARSRGVRS
jgi:hypothetical protein